jgi:hypothetical protein
MDERLEKALAFSKYRMTIENRRKALNRRFKAMSMVHANNGLFSADQATIAFVSTLIGLEHDNAILIDTKGNPIEIDDLGSFKEELLNAYFEATNELQSEMKKLAKARDVKKAMDW